MGHTVTTLFFHGKKFTGFYAPRRWEGAFLNSTASAIRDLIMPWVPQNSREPLTTPMASDLQSAVE